MNKILTLCLCLFPLLTCSAAPSWMEAQIERDLHYFKDKVISLRELDEFYVKKSKDLSLVKYTILDNQVSVDQEYIQDKNPSERINRYKDILKLLCETKGLPDTTLLIAVSDGLNAKVEMPIFAMCKKDSDRIVLIPDYESLGSRYQVLKYDDIDITKQIFPWEKKISKMIWRGSTAQKYMKMKEQNLHLFSRVTLCQLSEEYPSQIDAKFTLFVQGADQLPSLSQYEGDHVSFLDQMNYKYHILIDGNVSPYSKSGWKFFTNSLLFKPESKWVQWYFAELVPYVHYIPVNEDLSDLVEKINWASKNDTMAKIIAYKCREFAISHITLDQDLEYLHEVIVNYSKLNFVP